MRVGTGIYVKGSAEAVELYKEAFGLELGYHVLNPDGSYFHSELYRGEEEMLSVVESPIETHEDHTVQMSVVFDTEDEVHKAYELLSKEGKIETPIGPLPWSPCAASLMDKFGVWWYISAPQHHPADDYDPTKPWDASMYKKPE